MRLFTILLLFVVFGSQAAAQSYDRNFVLTRTFLDKQGSSSMDQYQYYDDLGREEQLVQKKVTPNGSDLVYAVQYDSIGRKYRKIVPTISGELNGVYLNNILSRTQAARADQYPFEEISYEASPLNRTLSQTGAGATWHEAKKTAKMDYFINDTNTSGLFYARCYLVTDNYSLQTAPTPVYKEGELQVTLSVDEDNDSTLTFTNKQKQTLLTRQRNKGASLDTYYVYNDYDLLCYVLPPMLEGRIDKASLVLYGYSYKYDHRNRCIEKQLPGCEPVYFVHDRSDRVVLQQDGVQRTTSRWTVYKYDKLGRLLYSYEHTDATPKETLRSTLNPQLTTEAESWWSPESDLFGIGYTSYHCSSGTNRKMLSVNYYDNYTSLNLLDNTTKAALSYVYKSGYDEQFGNASGNLTGTRQYFLDGSGKSLITASYYDEKGHTIQHHSTNAAGGYEHNYYAYSFSGNPTKHYHHHTKSGNEKSIDEEYTYEYDHANRPTMTYYSLNGGERVRLRYNSYDGYGRLQKKSLHNLEYDYTYGYNIRDWVTSISGASFDQHLYYHNGVGTPCYNGNISSMTWKAGEETVERGYQFKYDGLSRLEDAIYGEGNNLGANKNRFNEQVTAYDKMGNILNLKRFGQISDREYGLIDHLTMSYKGNQLTAIADKTKASTHTNGFGFKDQTTLPIEYTYDANGNLTQDLNKKTTDIQYNCLNLPSRIEFGDGNRISNLYSADGTKLQTTHITNGATATLDYCGNVIYENGTLSKILTAEGFITFSNATPNYHYFLQDHQGNNRVVIDQNGTVEEVNHYYPFGGLFGEGAATVGQPYKYNGKELDRTNGLDWYDYGSRHYDAALGRFTTMDRYSEKYYSQSPYHYAANNPIKYIDLKGDSTAVFLAGGTVGHVAILSQNKEGKWRYYSFNGVPWNKWSLGNLGKKQDDTGKVEFNTIEDFLKSKYVVTDTNADEDAGYEYTEGYVLPTSSEQDDQIQQGAKDTMDKGYDLDSNNCADAVRNGLGRAGIKLNKLEKSLSEIPYFKTKTTIKVSTPNHIFNQVKKMPNGRYIKIQ